MCPECRMETRDNISLMTNINIGNTNKVSHAASTDHVVYTSRTQNIHNLGEIFVANRHGSMENTV